LLALRNKIDKLKDAKLATGVSQPQSARRALKWANLTGANLTKVGDAKPPGFGAESFSTMLAGLPGLGRRHGPIRFFALPFIGFFKQ
jgi:hypothetical protein